MSEFPKAKENIDWTNVIASAESHIDEVFNQENEEGVNEDDEHYIFEAVIEAMYGKDIWAKYNQQIK